MADRIKVTYLDGRAEVVSVTPRAQVEAERHFKGVKDENYLQMSFWLAWFGLTKIGKESVPFDDWLDLIIDAEKIDADDDDLDPTTGATTTGTTSDIPKLTESSPSPLPLDSHSES